MRWNAINFVVLLNWIRNMARILLVPKKVIHVPREIILKNTNSSSIYHSFSVYCSIAWALPGLWLDKPFMTIRERFELYELFWHLSQFLEQHFDMGEKGGNVKWRCKNNLLSNEVWSWRSPVRSFARGQSRWLHMKMSVTMVCLSYSMCL